MSAVTWSGLGTIVFFSLRAIGFFRASTLRGRRLAHTQLVGLVGLIVTQGFLGGVFMLLLVNDKREPVLNQPIIGLIVGIAAGALLQTAGEVSQTLSAEQSFEQEA